MTRTEAGAEDRGWRRGAEWVLAGLLFALLLWLSWRRWASFEGDLNREWTTPARVAAGERLYREVAFYYGPLVPWAESAAFRLFGERVGTAIGFGIAAAAGTLGLVLLASRRFLPLPGRLGLAAFAVGVLAFAPENGAFVAPYSLSALLAIGLSWLALVLARWEPEPANTKRSPDPILPILLAGVVGGLALLAKVEALPALLVVGLRVPRRSRPAFGAAALAVAAAGYGWAVRGIPFADLVTYGPLRHAGLPAEFRELYARVSGLHPALLPGALHGALAGFLLGAGWLLGVSGLLARRSRAAALGLGLLAGGVALWLGRSPEPLLTTAVRGIPFLLVAALVLSLSRLREGGEAADAAAAAGLGLAFGWRTALWTVPSFPYAPMAALSAVPAVAWLASRLAPSIVPEPGRRRAAALLCLPLLAAPLVFLPRLVEAYRSPREAVAGPRGRWFPPGDDGALYQAVLDRLQRLGVSDRSLVVVPEATALGFLLGVRSPLALEQLLPGHLDARADAATARRLDESRPALAVWLPRATAEYAGSTFGRDYGTATAAALARDYEPVVTFRLAGDPRRFATILKRRALP